MKVILSKLLGKAILNKLVKAVHWLLLRYFLYHIGISIFKLYFYLIFEVMNVGLSNKRLLTLFFNKNGR